MRHFTFTMVAKLTANLSDIYADVLVNVMLHI